MSGVKLHRPSPAFVLAVIALFVALGGTGYAATKVFEKGKAKPLTKAQVNKQIAGYVSSHKSELTGPAGAAGATGAAGPKGDQGPGAIPIATADSSATPAVQTIANMGPWSLTLKCAGGSPNATLIVHGPGEEHGETTLAVGGNAGSSYVGGGPIGNGFASTLDDGAQMKLDYFLKSGSTEYEVSVYMSAVNGGLFSNCDVVGDAIPVS